MSLFTDTILAVATPPGRSGVAVLRLSGPQALAAAFLLSEGPPLPARQAVLRALYHPRDKRLIDQALLLSFPAPHSFTGEDVLEIQCHGSRAVLQLLLDVLTAQPLIRLAEPGEFARRAFFLGKMDLTQAEGLADLIDAETQAQHGQALRQLQGEHGEIYRDLRERVVEAMALVEAMIDFPDEDIPPSVLAQFHQKLAEATQRIQALLADGKAGERLRDGFTVVIAGAPNAGKSSLLNALARRNAAIVSDMAGTTRDLLEVAMEIDGLPVTLIDTAGLREAQDEVEAEGIRRARQRAAEADLVVVLFDGAQWPQHDATSQALLAGPALGIISKSDCLRAPPPYPFAAISVHQNTGLHELVETIAQRLRAQHPPGSSVITRARHRLALGDALRALQQAAQEGEIELQAEQLRIAALEIGKITGAIALDDVLDVVFSSFCIGK